MENGPPTPPPHSSIFTHLAEKEKERGGRGGNREGDRSVGERKKVKISFLGAETERERSSGQKVKVLRKVINVVVV